MALKRIILKISGEYLAGKNNFGFDQNILNQLSDDIIEVKKLGIDIGIVLGGGNIYRGAEGEKGDMDRVTGDNTGMLATLQNSLVLGNTLIRKGFPIELFSALQIDKVARFYRVSNVIDSFAEGKICFLACGTGNPFFTTDTAAVLRAVELKACLVLKGTKVDGVYSSDPTIDDNAVLYSKLSYDEALDKRLKVMDITAFSLARENKMTLKVFNISRIGNIKNAVFDPEVGTLVD